MSGGFLLSVLNREPGSKTAVRAWSAFFLLCPLAYVCGSFLQQRELAKNFTGVAIDRGSAIAMARQFLTDRGLDTTEWSAYASVDPLTDLMRYYRIHRDTTAASVQSFSPPITARILLISGSGDMAAVTLDSNGRVVGYDLTQMKAATAGPDPGEQAATAIASYALVKIPNLTKVLQPGKPEIGSVEHTRGGACRKFTWHAAASELPGLSFEITSAVCGIQPAAQAVKTTLDKAYAKAHSMGTSTSLVVMISIYGVYIAFVFIYSFYRYARRAFEREVSHKRTVAIGLFIAAAFIMNFLTALDEYVMGNYAAAKTVEWFPLFAVAVVFCLMGLAIAIAYEAGEGDLRELHPGKLTSLDALLRGKIFSRNVARSMLFGTAYAGWMLLTQGIVLFLMRAEAGDFAANLLKFPFFRYPIFAVFFGQAIAVTLLPASGLLLPLGFLHRNVRRIQVRNVVLLILVLVASLIHAAEWSSLATAFIPVTILAACLLGPYLAFDFLAVTFSLLTWQVANTLARLVGLSSSWIPLSIGVGVIALAFLIIEAWAALHGPEYSDAEVRPLYARHIAERQSLQAEVAAAREAQLHLLPKTVPVIYGLEIAAECIPARVVGGDFYDFFPLSDHRLGIFIAEGGNRGIGSALTIALAKGFLMHTVRRNLAPHEVVMRLEAALGDLLEGSCSTTTVAYAVLDTARGELRYARTGDYPKVMVASRKPNEIRIDIPESNKAIYAATMELRGGDSIMLFTDGIARRVRISGSLAADELLRALKHKRPEQEIEDDLTAVIVRVTRIGAALEVVA